MGQSRQPNPTGNCSGGLSDNLKCTHTGVSVVCYAKFYLKNDSVLDGRFYVFTDFETSEQNKKLYNNAGVLKIFKAVQEFGNAPVPVYKNIRFIKVHPFYKMQSSGLLILGCTILNDLVLINAKDIRKMVFQKVEPPVPCDAIVNCSTDMLDTFRQNKYWNCLYVSASNNETSQNYVDFGPDGGFALYNFNPKINAVELKRLAQIKFPLDMADLEQKYYRRNRINLDETSTVERQWVYKKFLADNFEQLKRWYWKRGILLFQVEGFC